MRSAPVPYYLYCELDQEEISELFSKVEKNVFTIFYSDDVVLTNGEAEISENLINHIESESRDKNVSYIDQFKIRENKISIW